MKAKNRCGRIGVEAGLSYLFWLLGKRIYFRTRIGYNEERKRKGKVGEYQCLLNW